MRFPPLIYCLITIFWSYLGSASKGPRTPSREAQFLLNQKLIRQRPSPHGDFNNLTIPVRRVGNLVVLEAEIDGIIGNFILDTGAPYLILNETYFRDYEEDYTYASTDVNGNLRPQRIAKVDRLSIRKLYWQNLEADVANLSAIENKRGIKIFGLLGVNLFMKLQLELNLKTQQLQFKKLDRNGVELLEDKSQQIDAELLAVIPFEYRNNNMVVDAIINKNPLRFCFDTGAELSVLSSDLDEAIYEGLQVTGRKTLFGAGGHSTEVLFGKLPLMSVGTDLRNCSLLVADLRAIGKAFGYRLDGFVGFDLLKQGRLEINFVKLEMRLRSF
jgi:predicted aspartyl protease